MLEVAGSNPAGPTTTNGPGAGAESTYSVPAPACRMGLRNRLKKYCVMKKVRESADDEDGGADGRSSS